jgi:DNA-binding HxlR family transcriptional regulator
MAAGTHGPRGRDGSAVVTAPTTNSALDEAMARVGDRWTLLIVDALLDGPCRFKDLESALPGLASNVLTARLRRLESEGLVVASPYSVRPARYEYSVSAEGRELAGALRLLARWGARAAGDEVEGPRHRSCGTPLEAHWYCPTCERVTDGAADDAAWL